MNRTGTPIRAGAVLAAAVLLAAAAPLHAATAASRRSDSVVITVDSVSPSTPAPSDDLKHLTVTLTLRNTTGADIENVDVVGERGDPFSSQTALDAALADAAPSTSGGLPITPTHPVHIDVLRADTPVQVTFETGTSILDDGTGICLCARAYIYPLIFTAQTLGTTGVVEQRGVAATYLPSFDGKLPPVQPVQVSWIWPLLERPHRLTDDTVFTDDLLTASVDGGRLSRALDVVEGVGRTVPLTLLIDPELLAELETMASTTTPYTVATTDGHSVPGTGQAAASTWLDRLRTVLTADPKVRVELTAYADPDVESLSERGLSWSGTMPAEMAAQVSDALAGRAMDSSLSWPATGAISQQALHALADQGVSTVVLNSAAVAGPRLVEGAVAPGLASLHPGRDVTAALTSPAIENYVRQAVTEGGRGAAVLPELVAELAVRATQDPEVEHAVAITAPRYVDPDVAAAVRTIEETSSSTFARPTSLADLVGGALRPKELSHLGKVPPAATAHPSAAFAAAANAAGSLPTISSLLDQKNDAAARDFVTGLSRGVQRAESSAWRRTEEVAAGAAVADQLETTVERTRSGVQIVRPSRDFTLASNTSPLPITVDNELPYAVRVRISITTVPVGVQGFTYIPFRDPQGVEAGSKRTLNIPATTERVGRIRIQATLRAPNGDPLGLPVEMRVRSTALGIIGVVITVVAGVVLGIALLWRAARRLRNRRVTGVPPADPLPVGEPEPIP